MTTERAISDDLIAEYVLAGWTIDDPEKARDRIDFLPDFFLRRGDARLVVEIKQPGRQSGRPVSEMRKLVEQQPNWHFAVKLEPPRTGASTSEIAGEEVGSRLAVAGYLLEGGHRDEAILIAWVAIEMSLRRLTSDAGSRRNAAALPDLVRHAYEAEAISDAELRQINRARDLRNQIVHGFKARTRPQDGEDILSLAKVLHDRAVVSEPDPSTPPSP